MTIPEMLYETVGAEITCVTFDVKPTIRRVGVTEKQRKALEEGELICPACRTPCKPVFREIEYVARGISVVAWNGTAWQKACSYKTNEGPRTQFVNINPPLPGYRRVT